MKKIYFYMMMGMFFTIFSLNIYSNKNNEINNKKEKSAFSIFNNIFYKYFAKNKQLKIKYIKLNSIRDIENIENKVEPIIYDVNKIDINSLNTKEKKEAFINIMLPAILIVRNEIELNKVRILSIKTDLKNNIELSKHDNIFLENNFVKYRVKNRNIDELLARMTPHPTSVVLAQAIIESAWGTSRFFKEANNTFGIWSFNELENRIVSKNGVRNGKKVYLKKYNNLKQGIEDYYIQIGRGKAYNMFRKIRTHNNDYSVLVYHLEKYSELGSEYGNRLMNIIEYNNLSKYDKIMLKI